MNGSARISPTAHYTAYVWARHGLGPDVLATPLGAALYLSLRPANLAWEQWSSRPSLDQMLLARHRSIDWLLEREIRAGRVAQVLEVAAGLSPRGVGLSGRYPRLRYVEADLPAMAAHKRGLLEQAGLLAPDHRVVEVDALAGSGDDSVAAVAARELRPDAGTALVTEGLIGYFDGPAVRGMWTRFAEVLARFPAGVYLSDLHLAGEVGGMRGAAAFRCLLSAFVQGATHLHFDDDAAAVAALRAAGFAEPYVHGMDSPALAAACVPARERGHVVRVIEAWARPAGAPRDGGGA